ncbi:hypothetical protein NFI96_011253 [Prochilodus magdalenae]|nr:hypothetical protein NFI96_011253 [Prochilodus magdalenae]
MNNHLPLIVTSVTLFLAGLTPADPHLVYVTRIKNPTHLEEYQCVVEPDAGHVKYSWHRQGWNGLPEGVKADGDRLHFLKSTSDLNGVYICEVENLTKVGAGSLYRHKQPDGHTEF